MTDLGITGISDAELIASGGSALVYRATDHTEAGPIEVAVKLLRGVRGTEVARRFEREQSAAERLQEHPHIIEIYRSGVSGAGEPFLIMPLMEAGSLADQLDRDGAFNEAQAVADVAAASEAIDFAHRRGVLHRDLKPGNLLRRSDGSIVVTDFGIARVLDAGISSATIGATTPLYAAPELLEENDASEQSDVYSLGALLFALLAGAPAFSDSPNIWQTIGRIRDEAVPTLPNVSKPVMAVIEQAMSKSPMDRPPTAHQFHMNLLDATKAGPNWRPPAPAEMTLQRPPGPDMVPAVPAGASQPAHPIPSPTSVPQPLDTPRQPAKPGLLERETSGMGKFLYAVAALLLIVGIGAFAINRAFSGDTPAETVTERPPPVDTSLPPITPFPTVDPDEADQVDGVPTAEPDDTEPLDPEATPAPEPTPTGRIVAFTGQHFQAYFPEGWSVARSDRDVGYGFRSEFVADEMYLNIDTTPSERRTGSGDIGASAREIAASVSSASGVTTETIDDLTMHSFTFRNNRGIDSIDIFFEVDGDGYAIVAGSNTRPADVFDVARQVALTIRSAA